MPHAAAYRQHEDKFRWFEVVILLSPAPVQTSLRRSMRERLQKDAPAMATTVWTVAYVFQFFSHL